VGEFSSGTGQRPLNSCVCVCVFVLAVRTPDQLIVVMLLEYQLPSHVSSAPQLITPSGY